LGSTNLLNIALAFGLAIFVLVYAAASFSGKSNMQHIQQQHCPALHVGLLLSGCLLLPL
jgi:glycerol uptake facilitator-like aquaporin